MGCDFSMSGKILACGDVSQMVQMNQIEHMLDRLKDLMTLAELGKIVSESRERS